MTLCRTIRAFHWPREYIPFRAAFTLRDSSGRGHGPQYTHTHATADRRCVLFCSTCEFVWLVLLADTLLVLSSCDYWVLTLDLAADSRRGTSTPACTAKSYPASTMLARAARRSAPIASAVSAKQVRMFTSGGSRISSCSTNKQF